MIYLYGLFPRRFPQISQAQLRQELEELFLLNLDTNYLIDANNLLRFGYR